MRKANRKRARPSRRVNVLRPRMRQLRLAPVRRDYSQALRKLARKRQKAPRSAEQNRRRKPQKLPANGTAPQTAQINIFKF